MRIAGIIVLACGLVGVLLSARYASWFAEHFRFSRREPAPSPEQVAGRRRLLIVMNVWGALLLIAVGAMWIAGIGTK